MNSSQQLQAKILSIFTALIAGVSTWKPTTNLANIISDTASVVNTVEAVDPSVLPQSLANEIGAVPAEIGDVANGQLAIIGSTPASFDGVHDEILFFAVRKYVNGTAPADSPAAYLKTQNGY